jgi:hypothetical protein
MTNDPFDALGLDDPVVEPDADFAARLGRRLGVLDSGAAAATVASIDLVPEVVAAHAVRRRRGFVVPLVAAAVVLAALGAGVVRSESHRVATAPSDAISDVTLAPVAVTTLPAPPTTNSEQYETPEPGIFDVSTVEDLTRTSDLIGFVKAAQKLNGLVQVGGGDAWLVDVQFSEVLRGEATEHTLVLVSKEQAALIENKQALLFLRTPRYDLFPAANMVGPVLTLTPGQNSIMVPDGSDLVTTGRFSSLRRQETFGGPAGKRLPRRDVVAVASDPTIGPTTPWPSDPPPPPPLSDADVAWLARLDASCVAAKQSSTELKRILTDGNAAGSLTPADAAGALELFNQLRAGEEPLSDQTGVSADIVERWQRGKLLLADADAILNDALPLTGTDLTDSLMRFQQKAKEYQDQWLGTPARNCTTFL